MSYCCDVFFVFGHREIYAEDAVVGTVPLISEANNLLAD